jgi:hypothetical protein
MTHNYQPNDKVVWTSPHTGNQTVVSYRGEHSGKAIIWTGTMHIAVPFDELKPVCEHEVLP